MAFGNDAASNYFRQRLDNIQRQSAAGDYGAAGEDLRRLNRLSEYMRSYQLPAQLSNAVQNRMIANPMQSGIERAGESAMYDVGTMFPRYGQDEQGAMAAQYLPNYLPAPRGAGTAMAERVSGRAPRPGTAAGDSFSSFSDAQERMPGVTSGMVNGRRVVVPIAGRAGEYQSQMNALGLDPNNENGYDAFEAAQEKKFTNQLNKYRKTQEVNKTVLASANKLEGEKVKTQGRLDVTKLKTAADLEREIKKGEFKIKAVQDRMDGMKEIHMLDNEGRNHVAIINRDGRTWVQQGNAVSRENAARIKAGLDVITPSASPQTNAGGGWSFPGFSSLKSIFGDRPPEQAGTPYHPAGGADLASGQPAINPREYNNSKPQTAANIVNSTKPEHPQMHPVVEQVYNQMPDYARKKFENFRSANPAFSRDFNSDTPENQIKFLRHLTSGSKF